MSRDYYTDKEVDEIVSGWKETVTELQAELDEAREHLRQLDAYPEGFDSHAAKLEEVAMTAHKEVCALEAQNEEYERRIVNQTKALRELQAELESAETYRDLALEANAKLQEKLDARDVALRQMAERIAELEVE